jgi:HK97 family phage major capsid protein
MATLTELKESRAREITKAENILNAAERQKRNMTLDEKGMFDGSLNAVNRIDADIAAKEKTERPRITTPEEARAALAKHAHISRIPAVAMRALTEGFGMGKETIVTGKTKLSSSYRNNFYKALTGDPTAKAALYEAVQTSGGYAVPITVDEQIVPLAPQDLAVRRLATVVSTDSDVLVPQKATFSLSALVPETLAFPNSAPSLGQFTLSAFMSGVALQTTLQLLEDIPTWEKFVVNDVSLAVQQEEDALFVSGTGSGQPQGLLNNVGPGVTEELDSNNNAVTINGTLDLIGTLKEEYLANASWLMSRTTGVVIRKAQVEQNIFFPAWTRVGSQDYLHGFPVYFSSNMPTAARGNAPVLFGDFKQGYVIGDRGGPAIKVKVVDQLLASTGLITLICFRRTDGRVRRSEAIQQYNVALS